MVRATVWAFIYFIEHTKTKGGGVKMYTFMNLQTAVLFFILGFCNHNERWICFSLHSGLNEL